jgi:hypothetical protein
MGMSRLAWQILLVVATNSLVVAVVFAWPITVVEAIKSRVSWQHWLILLITTLLLSEVKAMFGSILLLRYLPRTSFHFHHPFFVLLPGFSAMSAVAVSRRLSSYVLLFGGATSVLLLVAWFVAALLLGGGWGIA